MSEDWKFWTEEGGADAIIPQVDAVAVYLNQTGEIVIRQKNSQGEEDALIVFPKDYIGAVISALEALKS